MKQYPPVSFNSIICDLKVTVIKPLSLLLLQLSCSIYHFYSLRKQQENHAQKGSEKKHNINQSRTTSFWKVSKRKGQCKWLSSSQSRGYISTYWDRFQNFRHSWRCSLSLHKKKKGWDSNNLMKKHPWQDLL